MKLLKHLREYFIIITALTGLLVAILVINNINTCRPAVFYIKSKALCQMHGIDKDECK